MITFKTFLTEKMDEKEQVFNAFEKFLNNGECKLYLEKNQATLKIGRFLLRGMDGPETDMGIDKIMVRQYRYPKDTNFNIHEKIDNWFKTKFGINYRSSVVFCRQTDENMDHFGDPHIILPCGTHKFCFSPKVFDLSLKIDPVVEKEAERELAMFFHRHRDSYLPTKKLVRDRGDVITGLFLCFYWFLSTDEFNSLSEDNDDDELHHLITKNLTSDFFNNELTALFEHVKDLMTKSKTKEHFMSLLLAVLGYKSIDQFKQTMIRMGDDYMSFLGFKETYDQTTIRPLRNEIMLNCQSYIAIPFKYKKLLIEYITNENI